MTDGDSDRGLDVVGTCPTDLPVSDPVGSSPRTSPTVRRDSPGFLSSQEVRTRFENDIRSVALSFLSSDALDDPRPVPLSRISCYRSLRRIWTSRVLTLTST